MLDIPCGDFYWMKEVDLKDIEYIGADIVDELIKKNNDKFKAVKQLGYNFRLEVR